MRRFRCDRCGAEAAFTDPRCSQCGVELGYEPADLTLHALDALDARTYRVHPGGRPYWRCLNAAWGCNWLVEADGSGVWCRSCGLTRGRPDTADPSAVQAWATAESAKRRIVHQLGSIGLPLVVEDHGTSRSLTFDLVHVPGQPEVTGHFQGVITIDLTEADELHRTSQRVQLREGFRTLLGHIRHELGHFYVEALLADPDRRHAFRLLFGDERADYPQALRRHYEHPRSNWQEDGFISAYAGSHPTEDWAESFGHYLAIRDGAETMAEHAMVGHAAVEPQARASGWQQELDVWRRGVRVVNAVAEGLGHSPVYPMPLTPAVVRKLAFVDECVRAAASPAGATRGSFGG